MYETRDEAQNRLLNSVVTYDGKPVRVIDVGGRTGAVTLSIMPWPFNAHLDVVTVRADDPLFNNFRTPPLGFLNYFEQRGQMHASWLERVPARRMNQGLVDGNTRVTCLGPMATRLALTNVMTSDAFREMIAGEYPTFDQVNELLVPNSSIAVDRNFALLMSAEGYVTIYHQREPLGLVRGSTIFLRADREYSREMLMECPRLPNDIQNL